MERIKSSLALQSERLLNLPTNDLVLYSFGVGATSALVARSLHVRYLRRIPNAGWVNPNMLERRRWIKGYVTRCSLNFRIRPLVSDAMGAIARNGQRR